jgi:hypothetical protein
MAGDSAGSSADSIVLLTYDKFAASSRSAAVQEVYSMRITVGASALTSMKMDDESHPRAAAKKHIDWYTELPVTAAAVEFAATSGLVDGVMVRT